jgi:hypothetical protein
MERFIAFGLPCGLLGGTAGALLTVLFGQEAFIVLGATVPSLGVTVLLLLSHAEYQLDQAEEHIAGRERIAQRRSKPARQRSSQVRDRQNHSIWASKKS